MVGLDPFTKVEHRVMTHYSDFTIIEQCTEARCEIMCFSYSMLTPINVSIYAIPFYNKKDMYIYIILLLGVRCHVLTLIV